MPCLIICTTLRYKKQTPPTDQNYQTLNQPLGCVTIMINNERPHHDEMAAKHMTTRTLSATFPSPGASPCSEDGRGVYGGVPKGWCSERVPLSSRHHRSRCHRHVAAEALIPLGSGSSGRAFPSKWDDAERWISSPGAAPNYYYATGVANVKASQVGCSNQRRAKSKSGPLGPVGLTSYGSFNGYSPVLGMGVINGGRWRNSVAVESPASVRARLEEAMVASGGGGGASSEGGRRSCPGHGNPDWLDLWSRSPSPANQVDYKNAESQEINNELHQNENVETAADGAISRRDMATQMYTECESSCHSSVVSSPRSSISDNSLLQSMLDEQPHCRNKNSHNVQSPEYEFEVRDVQVDKQTSTSRRSTSDREELADNPGLASAFTEADKKFSKLEKEEARINAWENLQKAKAEAAIQKLEMKLEKQRASEMEKIVEKLRRAEIKAEKMRNSLSTGQAQSHSRTVSRTTSKIPFFCRKFKLTPCYPF